MVRLTAELIDDSRQFINAVSDRQLDLRDCKIPAIENIGATRNQFDTIDFSNNDLKKLDNIPLLPRLKSLLLNNNRVGHIQPDIGQCLPNLSTLVLINNNVQELGDLEPLTSLSKLEYLSLIGNPVTKKPQYRLYTIYSIPQVRVLDFKRIKMAEREEARKAFKGSRGREFRAKMVKKTKTFVAGRLADADDDQAEAGTAARAPAAAAPKDVQKIKEAIAAAKSLQEVENLQRMLASGQIPGAVAAVNGKHNNNGEQEVEIEEDEDEPQMEAPPSTEQNQQQNSDDVQMVD